MRDAWRPHTSESCSTRSRAACTTGVSRAGPLKVALCSAFLQDAHSHVSFAGEPHPQCDQPSENF